MIYLLHFATPFKHARHYVGFVTHPSGLDARIKKHKGGSGSKLMRAVSSAGIDFSIARTWQDGTRDQERMLKKRKETPQLCPICNPKAMNLAKDLTLTEKYTVIPNAELVKSITCVGTMVAIDSA